MKNLIFLSAGIFLSGLCSPACHPTADATTPQEEVIRKAVNEPFELTFEACHSCGYLWELERVDSTRIRLISKSSEPVNKTPGAVGGNAIETWIFTGLQPGEYQLVFRYKRPWEEEVRETERIRVIIGSPDDFPSTSTVSIVIPADDSGYRKKVYEFVSEGGEDPAQTMPFVTRELTIPFTRNIMQAAAQAAAEAIYPPPSSAGGPGVDSVVYFRLQHDTAYILLNMDVDGWAGVSYATGLVHPVVKRTLLQFPGIREVVFGTAPE